MLLLLIVDWVMLWPIIGDVIGVIDVDYLLSVVGGTLY